MFLFYDFYLGENWMGTFEGKSSLILENLKLFFYLWLLWDQDNYPKSEFETQVKWHALKKYFKSNNPIFYYKIHIGNIYRKIYDHSLNSFLRK